jgi:Skp family chaperone for outer membrane proteins
VELLPVDASKATSLPPQWLRRHAPRRLDVPLTPDEPLDLEILRMKLIARLTAATAILATATLSAETAPDPNVAEAKAIVKEFAETLQGELQAAIKEGGPVNAIAVCQDRAPAIAADLSERTGWEVGRTSLKTRNTADNAPDAWEAKVLAEFDERRAAGEDVQPMAYAATVTSDDAKTFRFMKAIPTADVCLACHGSDITPEVTAALDERYPDDMARGYSKGEVRGAFTLSKPL